MLAGRSRTRALAAAKVRALSVRSDAGKCGAMRVLEQARRVLLLKEALLSGMEDAGLASAYARVCPVVGASVGAHVRHAMDHYAVLVDAASKGETRVQYDQRARGTDVEHELGAGLEAILRCSQRMATLSSDVLQQPIHAEFNLDGDGRMTEAMPSTVARELWFVAHHSIHHQAMIKQVLLNAPEREALLQVLPCEFGLAPSTVLHHKQQSKSQEVDQCGQ